MFWVQLPFLLPLRLFPVSVIVALHQSIVLLIAANFFVDFGGCECPLGKTKKAAMECPSPPLL